jgi:hypothetical protein
MRADLHHRTKRINEETGLEQDILYIEAFLLQATLLEGVLVNLGLKLLEKRRDLSGLKGKRHNKYGYDNAINDLYLMGEIETDDFNLLEKYKSKRNQYIHNLLSKKTEDVEEEVLAVYNEYEDFVWKMIKKLEKITKK